MALFINMLRPPARLSAVRARLPASQRSVLPEADGSRRLQLAPPLPLGLLRLPLTPASGQEKASSPLGLLPRFPAATNGPPPPGSRARPLVVEDQAGARAGQREGPESGGRGLRSRPPPPARRCTI
ncbi:actin nucleation-promoting factor WAS-like [Pongo pygmaeus]|uniref:actin nucleation-promoting factor WAS-like n=1 Tax=Pongo pygmaeus TaxID=9600 RepID=UPI00300C6957